ncbi:MAG TPA: FadR/GntR family transcriptional regulator [Acetobacteraceae bacterium]|nr:FadR/GntR family transcriptional regulator [Acetobacteraceae bacterium]
MAGVDAYAPVERNSLAERVANRLIDLVRTRNLKPGDMLPPERELAMLLQVSRPSVREAVRGLQILGVLKARQGSGISVSSLEAADLLTPLQMVIALNAENAPALHEARVLIDGEIARLAATALAASEVHRLREMLSIQRGLLGDPIAFRVSDMEFHRTIAEATGNPFLQRISLSLYVLGMEYRRIASEMPGVLARSLADHAAIVDALAARDPDAAAEAMHEHMHNIHRSTLVAMGQA